MLKMLAVGRDGRKVVVFGLSHNNLRELKAGHPISFKGDDYGFDGQVIICSGETEQSMARDVAEFIGPNTNVKIDPRLKD